MGNGRTSGYPNLGMIVALVVGNVCDGRHSLVVMKTWWGKNTVQAVGEPTSQTRDVGAPRIVALPKS
jgi:hypothetical protein